jgi:chemotaxis protein histidine kinase CheA
VHTLGQLSQITSTLQTMTMSLRMVPIKSTFQKMVRLDKFFNCSLDVHAPWEALVVTVEYDGRFMCLLLDELLGKEDVVIKSLGEYMQNVKGIAGGAIMGDGKVGLILDMASLKNIAARSWWKARWVKEPVSFSGCLINESRGLNQPDAAGF